MISVHYDRKNLDLTVQGHAGYAEPGKDIVCSAVSILTSTLAFMLARNEFESCFEPELSAFRAIVPNEGVKKRYRPYFEFVMEGLRMLQAAYPENILILEEKDTSSVNSGLPTSPTAACGGPPSPPGEGYTRCCFEQGRPHGEAIRKGVDIHGESKQAG